MTRQLDYFFSAHSPWAYIGHRIFVETARRHDLAVTYRPVSLPDVFAETGGLPLAKRHPARQAYRLIELQRWRDKRGLSFQLKPTHWPFDPNLADRVMLAVAATASDPAAFVQSVFVGVWEQQKNLADPTTLSQLLAEAGFRAADILAAAETADVKGRYERNRLDAIAIGAFGSPCYVLEGEVFWGQDRLDLLEDALRSRRPPYSASAAK
jgi:2-hydroxychromene-2-carboxylate isomerase